MVHKIQVLILFLLVPFLGLYLYAKSQDIPFREIFAPGTPVLHINEIPMTIEIVSSQAARTKGLSGRSEMRTDGMLFVFDTSDYHGIWMKDMLFAIDIIWVDESLKVVGVERGVRPDSYPRSFRPSVPAKYAIETKDGYTETFSVSVGDTVRLPLQLDSKK